MATTRAAWSAKGGSKAAVSAQTPSSQSAVALCVVLAPSSRGAVAEGEGPLKGPSGRDRIAATVSAGQRRTSLCAMLWASRASSALLVVGCRCSQAEMAVAASVQELEPHSRALSRSPSTTREHSRLEICLPDRRAACCVRGRRPLQSAGGGRRWRHLSSASFCHTASWASSEVGGSSSRSMWAANSGSPRELLQKRAARWSASLTDIQLPWSATAVIFCQQLPARRASAQRTHGFCQGVADPGTSCSASTWASEGLSVPKIVSMAALNMLAGLRPPISREPPAWRPRVSSKAPAAASDMAAGAAASPAGVDRRAEHSHSIHSGGRGSREPTGCTIWRLPGAMALCPLVPRADGRSAVSC
mmetsp:Transcript_28119/g.79439  ORF Transcript_28119/g.79439 Transcript_28119/m.79439 type:complete len:360 (+) Transcript_28119:324-1403(+)